MAVIVDVEATPARLSQEIVATRAMLERVDQRHALRPGTLAADKAVDFAACPCLWMRIFDRELRPSKTQNRSNDRVVSAGR